MKNGVSIVLLPILSLLLGSAEATPFSDAMPAMIEACLQDAIATGEVRDVEGNRKYICGGVNAQALWTYLEKLEVDSWEQDAGDEGHWLTREFPLGACFKRIRTADGLATTDGLSCSIWIPIPREG